MAITVVCYLTGLVVKAMPLPDFPFADPLTVVGIVSRLTDVGVNRVVKQQEGSGNG
ncbi:hypothetical protein OBV_16560 [Oscillibacter valericigenes Sjm18-20]|nr:hypothetical protein OBV_16560 [Oscillibacter valericigenes Sjm18-20]